MQKKAKNFPFSTLISLKVFPNIQMYEEDDFEDDIPHAAVELMNPDKAEEEYEETFEDENTNTVDSKASHKELAQQVLLQRLLSGAAASLGVQSNSYRSCATQSGVERGVDASVQAPEDRLVVGEKEMYRSLDSFTGQTRFIRFIRVASEAMEAALEEARLESVLRPAALSSRRAGAAGLSTALPSTATLAPPPPTLPLAAAAAIHLLSGAFCTPVESAAWALATAQRPLSALALSPARAGDYCCAYGPASEEVRKAWGVGVPCSGSERLVEAMPVNLLSSGGSVVGVWTGGKVSPPVRAVATREKGGEGGGGGVVGPQQPTVATARSP